MIPIPNKKILVLGGTLKEGEKVWVNCSGVFKTNPDIIFGDIVLGADLRFTSVFPFEVHSRLLACSIDFATLHEVYKKEGYNDPEGGDYIEINKIRNLAFIETLRLVRFDVRSSKIHWDMAMRSGPVDATSRPRLVGDDWKKCFVLR